MQKSKKDKYIHNNHWVSIFEVLESCKDWDLVLNASVQHAKNFDKSLNLRCFCATASYDYMS
jgi:hypothetical protein